VALDKRQQAFLYDRCRDALGDEAASLLMSELPPSGWENIATKQDVERLDSKIEVLEHKLTANLGRALAAQGKVYIGWTTGLAAVLAGVYAGITAIVVR
jgi:hypothetical protein